MIGENIKKIRLKRGWTQKQLAEKSGVTRESIGNYERNDRTPPADILNDIAKALSVPVGELLGMDKKEYYDFLVFDTFKPILEMMKEYGSDNGNLIMGSIIRYLFDITCRHLLLNDLTQPLEIYNKIFTILSSLEEIFWNNIDKNIDNNSCEMLPQETLNTYKIDLVNAIDALNSYYSSSKFKETIKRNNKDK